ncbi:MAG: hypothetical protein ACRBG0_18865 [Lewinella sp.]|uniref:hypothetical protein n=1 Tax=Lewinella sp. TaxID=2004506 RepID=UPI003D6AD09A
MKMINKYLPFLLLLLVLFCMPLLVEAQCPMCRMTAESNLANGGQEGEGLNNGILYMLATPYLLIGVIGYVWWRNRKKDDEVELETK